MSEYKVVDVNCTDDSTRTRGIVVLCDGRNLVSLVCDYRIPYPGSTAHATNPC